MATKWRRLLERLEAEHVKKMEWEEEHPPITRISKLEADGKRKIQGVGQEGVTCDLPCYGNNIPGEYGHTLGMINVFSRDIRVEGFGSPREGVACYYGTTCDLTDGKVCVATDVRLRRAIER